MIDSDNDDYKNIGSAFQNDDLSGALTLGRFGLNGPIKGISEAFSSGMMTYNLNKRRFIKLALIEAIGRIKKMDTRGMISLKIIPICLSGVTNPETWERVKDIHTEFSISKEDNRAIDNAVEEILQNTFKDSLSNFKRRTFINDSDEISEFFNFDDMNTSLEELIIDTIYLQGPWMILLDNEYPKPEEAIKKAEILSNYISRETLNPLSHIATKYKEKSDSFKVGLLEKGEFYRLVISGFSDEKVAMHFVRGLTRHGNRLNIPDVAHFEIQPLSQETERLRNWGLSFQEPLLSASLTVINLPGFCGDLIGNCHYYSEQDFESLLHP